MHATKARLAFLPLLLACAAPEPAANTDPDPFAGRRILDLTHAIGADSPWWPGPATSPFHYDVRIAHADGSTAMGSYALPEHFGTHLDAPVHSAEGQAPVDEIPTERLFVPAVVLDVRAQAAADPDYAVSTADVRAWEAAHGEIPAGAVVLANTGWAQRWPDGAAYYATDADGRLHFPGFGVDAARFLVEERDIAGIGIDSGSVDPGASDAFPVHGIVNGSGAWHLENLDVLDALPAAGAWLIVAPIKIRGGSGGQARVFAIVP